MVEAEKPKMKPKVPSLKLPDADAQDKEKTTKTPDTADPKEVKQGISQTAR